MLADLPLSELRRYAPDVAEPADFDEFWSGQLAAARSAARTPEFTAASTAIRYADVFDVTFSGFAGDPVKGWLLVPHDPAPRGAVVVEYIGYGGGRGDPLDWLTWSSVGYIHLIMDTRGQGGAWRGADFAAFNHYAGPKDIAVYEFNGHEGGGTLHLRAKLDFLAATLAG